MTEPTTPTFTDCPIRLDATGTRREKDSMGAIDVPASHYWGAQTQRSLVHFSIGRDHMPIEVCHAYGIVKKAAAQVNAADGRMPQWKADAISRVADEVIAGKLGQIPALCLADRIGHPDEHERERGDRKSRHPVPWRHGRFQKSGSPQ